MLVTEQLELAGNPYHVPAGQPGGGRFAGPGGSTQPQGWIPPADWAKGQQSWEQRGEAAWHQKAAEEALADEKAEAAETLPWHEGGGDQLFYHDSLGIHRDKMPQLSGTTPDGVYHPSRELIPRFTARMAQKGVTITHERVDPLSLKATQTRAGASNVRNVADTIASGDVADTKPVLVSKDNRILDGHHTWSGRVLSDAEGTSGELPEGLPIIRYGLPARRLLDEAHAFNDELGIQGRGINEVSPGNPSPPPVPLTASEREHSVSLRRYTDPNGDLVPHRQQLHDAIIQQYLSAADPVEHPVATFLGGGPAAGKSSVLSQLPENTVHVNPDEIKEQLPDYREAAARNDPLAGTHYHAESSLLAHQIRAGAERERKNFVYDGAGDSNYSTFRGKVEATRAAGHLTAAKYVTVPTDEAVRRAAARAQVTGRAVPESVLRAYHAGASGAFRQAIADNLFDTAELWDNHVPEGANPVLVGHKPLGGQWQVLDEQRWQQFLAKEHEPVFPNERIAVSETGPGGAQTVQYLLPQAGGTPNAG